MANLEKVFVRFKGRVLGPLTPEKTLELVRRGQITRQHELSPDRQSWASAESFTEFFPSSGYSQKSDSDLEPQASDEEKPSSSIPNSEEWYVRLGNESKGPFVLSSIRQMIESGKIEGNTLIWQEGMANWMDASVAKPEWFARPSKPERLEVAIDSSQNSSNDLSNIIQMTLRSYGWAQFLAILGLIVTPVWLLGSIAYFLFLVSRKGASEENIGGLLISLAGCAFSVATLVAFLLLFRYTSLTGILRYQPTTQNLLNAQNALGRFWKFSGITTLVWLCVYMFLIMLFYIMGLKLLR